MSLSLATELFLALGHATERSIAFRKVDGSLMIKDATSNQIQC